MTIDELSQRLEARFDKIQDGLSDMKSLVAAQGTTLSVHDKGMNDLFARVNKLEKWMWATLGSGATVGTGFGAIISKLFL